MEKGRKEKRTSWRALKIEDKTRVKKKRQFWCPFETTMWPFSRFMGSPHA